MTLTSGRGPLSAKPAGRFSEPVPSPVVYVEPLRRRVRAVTDGRAVIDSEQVLLVHRPGRPPVYAFAADAVPPALAVPVTEAPGYVEVPWDAADAWYEEDLEVFGHARNPYHRVDCLRTERHLRVDVDGSILVDGPASIALYETALEPRLYVDRDAVRMDLLVPCPTTTWCNYKGKASYWSAVIGDRTVDDVAWTYEDPLPESVAIAGLLAFDPAVADVTEDFPPPVF